MAVKKSEIYSTLWSSCDELRGGMDASQYKDYVLVMLFLKYVSDKKHSDKIGEFLIDVPEGCYYEDIEKLCGRKDVGEKLNEIIGKIRDANPDLAGAIDVADFNDSNKLGEGDDKVSTLSKLIMNFSNEKLNFGNNRKEDDDLMGDAYEYLMKNFASQSGKSKGQFYTPAEVSRLMAKLLGLNEVTNIRTTIYDPTCGSASLLLRALAETKDGNCATLYGQEKDSSTAGLAKMNLLLHGYDMGTIWTGDTLNNPKNIKYGVLEQYDFVVANPPFSQKSWLKGAKEEDSYHRWGNGLGIGIPPASAGDYAFLLHIVKSMNASHGRGACILPHGVLFRGGAEAKVREYLLTKARCIKGIIGLPPNIFFGTGIPACIIILDNREAATRDSIFIIDAKDGFVKDGAKNRLREQDIRRIADIWKAGVDVPHYAANVKIKDIVEKNDCNLNIPRYIEPVDTEVIQDIEAHINGGIPKRDIHLMDAYWTACPGLQEALFAPMEGRKGYSDLRCKKEEIRDTIFHHPSFIRQRNLFKDVFDGWCKEARGHLICNLQKDGMSPKRLIDIFGSMLLESYQRNRTLVDSYDVYDVLMNYWTATMQDDFYMIDADGWKATLPKNMPMPHNRKVSDVKCDLLPARIVINEAFLDEQAEIDRENENLAKINSDISELVEKHSAEPSEDEESPVVGYLSLKNLGGKLTDANVKKRLKAAAKNTEEYLVLKKYLDLRKQLSETRKLLTSLDNALANKLAAKYESFTEQDIQHLVVDKKWFASISALLDGEIERVSQQLASQVTTLAERYGESLRDIDAEIAKEGEEVVKYLEIMGVKV